MKWCEIFTTGVHTDSKGRKKNWTRTDLEKIKENFEKVNPDVPICCGHPQSNSPAYGWWDSLKIVDDAVKNISRLFVSYKDVQPEFEEAVKKGLFKTRSLSLTEDLVPRHIAFLGAQAPAIKGMEQFCFEAETENDIIIDFSEENNETPDYNTDKGGRWSNRGVPPFVNKANVNNNTESEQSEPNGEEGASSPSDKEIHDAGNPSRQTIQPHVKKGNSVESSKKIGGSTNMPPAVPTNKKEGEQMTVELEKQLAAKDEELAAMRKELEETRQDALKKEFEEFCDNAITEGHILPSQRNAALDILFACSDTAINFSDGSSKGAIEVFKDFVKSLSQMDFQEIGDPEKVESKKSIDFSDATEVKENIQAIQKEYAEKGVELNPVQALSKLKVGK